MVDVATDMRAVLETLDRGEMIELVEIIASDHLVDLGVRTIAYVRWRAAARSAEAAANAWKIASLAEREVFERVNAAAKNRAIANDLMVEWAATRKAERRALTKSEAAWARVDRLWNELQALSREGRA